MTQAIIILESQSQLNTVTKPVIGYSQGNRIGCASAAKGFFAGASHRSVVSSPNARQPMAKTVAVFFCAF